MRTFFAKSFSTRNPDLLDTDHNMRTKIEAA